MALTIAHDRDTLKNPELSKGLQKWDACKPPYTTAHIKTCATAAKTILQHLGGKRRSKYESEFF